MYAYWDRPSEERVVTVWILIRAGWAPAAPSVRSRFRKLAVAHGAISWNTIPVAVMSPWANMIGPFGSPPPFHIRGSGFAPVYQVPARRTRDQPSARNRDVRFESCTTSLNL